MKNPTQPTRYFLILLVLTIFSFFVPIKIIPSPYNYLGVILILYGVVLNIWADQIFKREKTEIKYHRIPRKIVLSGPFRISRNPMYLGMFTILLGTSIMSKNIFSLIFSVIFVLIIGRKFISVEEKNMERIFGKEYLSYKKEVRRWL
jgi:protein-S-isoprenylcysteine O-methyltransferase Ste14